MNYDVYLYDAHCSPLSLTSVYIRAHEKRTGRHLNSKSPVWNPIASECAATLSWSSVMSEVHVFLDDPSLTYVASRVEGLNGNISGRFDLVVLAVSSVPHSGITKPSGTSTSAMQSWAEASPSWNDEQREAFLVLTENVRSLAPYRGLPQASHLESMALNWLKMLERLGLEASFAFQLAGMRVGQAFAGNA